MEVLASRFWPWPQRADRTTTHPYARKLFVLADAFRLLGEDDRARRLAWQQARGGWAGTAEDLVTVAREFGFGHAGAAPASPHDEVEAT